MSKLSMFAILGCGWDAVLCAQALRDVGVPDNSIELYSNRITDDALEHHFIPWVPDSVLPPDRVPVAQHIIGGDIEAYVEKKWAGSKLPKGVVKALAEKEEEELQQDAFFDTSIFEKLLGNLTVSMTLRMSAGDIRDIAQFHEVVFQTFPMDEAKINATWRNWQTNIPVLVYPREMLGEEDINDLRSYLPKNLRSAVNFRLLNGKKNGDSPEWWRATYHRQRLYIEYPPNYSYPDGDTYFGKYSTITPLASPWVPSPEYNPNRNIFLIGKKAEIRADLGFDAGYSRTLEILENLYGGEDEL